MRRWLGPALLVLLGCSAPGAVDAPTTTATVAIPAASPAPAPSRPVAVVEETPLRAGQTWSGTYVCRQGETHLELRIRRVDGYEIEATFDFAHAPSGAMGAFAMRGVYAPSTRYLKLAAADWITRPPGYVTVDLAGQLSDDLRTYSGKVEGPDCGEFSVQRP